MAWLFDGVNDTGTITPSGISGSSVLAISFWLYWDSYSDNDDLAMEYCPDINVNSGGFFVDPNGSYWGGGGKVVFAIGTGTTSSLDVSTITRPSAAAWHHWLVNFNTTSSGGVASVYIDGSAVTVTAQQSNFSGSLNAHSLYLMHRNGGGSGSLYGAGRICEVAIWTGISLTANEALAAMNDCGRVRPDSLVMYLPLWGDSSPEPNMKGSNSCTITGAVKTNHAPVRLFSRRFSRAYPESVGGGSTYNESGSGGVVLGSSGLVLANYSPTISGGASLGGSVSGIATYNPAAAGGVVLGGQAGGIVNYVPVASGGVNPGGASTIAGSYVITSSGGVVVGGSASPEGSTYSEVGSGGVILGGGTTSTALYTPVVAGGVSLGGFASSVLTCVVVGSGGVVTGGYGVITTPLQVVNLIYGRPLEITRITSVIPIRSLHVEQSRITDIEVSQMSLTIAQVTKTTSDNLTYTFDLRRISFLQNDPITGTPTVSQLSGTGSLTFTTPEVSGELVTVGIGGGTAGQTYRVGLLVTTVNGRTIDGLVDIRVVSRTSSG